MNKKIKKFIPLPILLAFVTAIFTNKMISQQQSFLENWMVLYVYALLVIIPIAILLITNINKVINKFLGNKNLILQGLAFVIPMISIMGSLMTGLSVISINTVESSQSFLLLWKQELINNLPIFISLGLLGGVIIKPLITKHLQKKQLINQIK